MTYGICNLSLVPVRAEAADTVELVTQMVYGEFFQVITQRKKWAYIRLADDSYEGWIDNKQFKEITEAEYFMLQEQETELSGDIVDFVSGSNGELIPITIGSRVSSCPILYHRFEGARYSGNKSKESIIQTSLLFLNSPYLWGGKSPFGIDCSGFTQLVYKLHGQYLLRDASLQATQGEALSFIEESEPGDLAFFDNDEGGIIHVGIIMADNYIIHAHGHVRIDRLDHSGIYNVDANRHTHRLRVIKRIF